MNKSYFQFIVVFSVVTGISGASLACGSVQTSQGAPSQFVVEATPEAAMAAEIDVFHTAVEVGNAEAVAAELQRGIVDINAVGVNGQTALDLISTPAVKRVLIDNGAKTTEELNLEQFNLAMPGATDESGN